jgi:hypothetical protein
MFIVPHGAPGGYEWFVALVVLVGLYFAVRNFMRARRNFLRESGLLRERHDLPDPNPIHPGPGPQERLRSLERRFRAVSDRQYVDPPSPPKHPPSPFSRLCESMKDAPPNEQASRVREHFGIVGGARPAEGRGRKGKRP